MSTPVCIVLGVLLSIGVGWPPIESSQGPSSGPKSIGPNVISQPGMDTTLPFCVDVPSEKSPLLKPFEVKVEVELTEAFLISAFVNAWLNGVSETEVAVD